MAAASAAGAWAPFPALVYAVTAAPGAGVSESSLLTRFLAYVRLEGGGLRCGACARGAVGTAGPGPERFGRLQDERV